jgi:hypothetical protein
VEIWQAAEADHDRRENLRDYFEGYDRSVNPNDIFEVTLDLVQKAIHMAPATSPGPDGVPFSTFKANLDLAGPILLDVCHFLGVKRGLDVLGNFNEDILFEKRNSRSFRYQTNLCEQLRKSPRGAYFIFSCG